MMFGMCGHKPGSEQHACFGNGLVLINQVATQKHIHGHVSLVEDVEGLLVPVPPVPQIHVSSGYMYYEMKICDLYMYVHVTKCRL